MVQSQRVHAAWRAVFVVIAFIGAALTAVPSASSAPPPGPAGLEVGAEGLPERVLALSETANALIAPLDRAAFLYEIWATPRAATSGNTASVVYSYYLPTLRARKTVTFANVAVQPELIAALKRAGQWEASRQAMASANKPTISDLADRTHGPSPYPLPVVKLDLREAYGYAKRAGLRSLDHAQLTVSTKSPNAPFVVWAFQGDFPGQDRAWKLYIDAFSGQTLPEKLLYAWTREDDTRALNANWAAVKARMQQWLRQSQGGGAQHDCSRCFAKEIDCRDTSQACTAATTSCLGLCRMAN